jgi:glutamate mutase epsilon subunit
LREQLHIIQEQIEEEAEIARLEAESANDEVKEVEPAFSSSTSCNVDVIMGLNSWERFLYGSLQSIFDPSGSDQSALVPSEDENESIKSVDEDDNLDDKLSKVGRKLKMPDKMRRGENSV